METLIFLALMLVIVWVFMILPQQRRAKRHKNLIQSIQVGDDILTTSGIYGTVTDRDDGDLFVEVSPGVEIRIIDGAVVTKVDYEDDDEATPDGVLSDDAASDEGDRHKD